MPLKWNQFFWLEKNNMQNLGKCSSGVIQVKRKKAHHDINGVLFRRREWLSEEKIVSRKKLKMIRTRNSIMAFLITSWLALSFHLLLKDMKLRQIKRARSDIKTGEESKVFYFKFRAVLFFLPKKEIPESWFLRVYLCICVTLKKNQTTQARHIKEILV